MKKLIVLFSLLIFLTNNALSNGVDVFAIGIFDVKFDGSDTNESTDFRYERRFDNTILDIGPKEDNFFFLKPFAGIEVTSDSASYFLTGIYLEDNLGQLFTGKTNNYIITPSFGFGVYDDGSRKKLVMIYNLERL